MMAKNGLQYGYNSDLLKLSELSCMACCAASAKLARHNSNPCCPNCCQSSGCLRVLTVALSVRDCSLNGFKSGRPTSTKPAEGLTAALLLLFLALAVAVVTSA